MVSTEHEPIVGQGAEPLVRGTPPLKLNNFLHYHKLGTRPVYSEICVLENNKFRRTFGSHPLDLPVSMTTGNYVVFKVLYSRWSCGQ